MAAPSIPPIELRVFLGSGRVATPALLGAMLRAGEKNERPRFFTRAVRRKCRFMGGIIPVPSARTHFPHARRHSATSPLTSLAK